MPTDNKAQFFALMERFNQLGCLLPAEDDLDLSNPAAVAEARIVLKEMDRVKAEMDGLMKLPT